MNGTRGVGRGIAVLAALLVLAASCTGGDQPATFHPQLAWGSCPSDVEVQYLSRHRCGWLTVLQDRAEPEGSTIRLFVVETWPVGVAPLPGLGSGFGDDLGNGYGYGDKAAGATRLRRAGVSMELRGTGHSQPSLACPEVDTLDGREADALTGDPSLLNDFLAAVRACRERLAAQGVDAADYDLRNVAYDMEDLRVALGLDQWASLNSYGSSSRYLFEYLREFPDRVRLAYFDSPQFPQADEITAGVEATRHVLHALFQACAANAGCAKAYPSLSKLWTRTLDRLDRHPLRGSATVDAGALLRATRSALGGDGPNQAGLNLTSLPETIAAIADGQITPELAAAVGGGPIYCAGYRPTCVGAGAEGFSLGAYLTVLCRDEAPFIDRAALSAAVDGDPGFKDVFEGDPYLAACSVWDVPPAPAAVHEPVRTDVPLLMFLGQFDSFSPVSEARNVAATLPSAWVVEVPGQTHNAIGFSDCPIGIRNAWVFDPTEPPADTSCLRSLGESFSRVP
jgi:pimeloyl-ACP methyl ester carboxylesterase